jgi:hypothetical protein
MRRNLQVAIALGVCLLGAAVVVGNRMPPVVHAQTKACDASSLSGAYGYTLNGFAYDNQFNLYLVGAAGRVTADGNGNLTGADTLSFDGSVTKRQYTGTYTVNEDCTGTLTFATSGGSTTHADFVAVNNAKEVNLVQTDSGFTVTGVLKQQSQ